MKTSKLIGTMVAVAALAAGLGAPTAALADGGRGEHRERWEHRHHGNGHWKHGHWKHRQHYRPYYYAPGYVVHPYRPPVVAYPAYPAYAPAYPVYPGGQITFSYSAAF